MEGELGEGESSGAGGGGKTKSNTLVAICIKDLYETSIESDSNHLTCHVIMLLFKREQPLALK